MKKICLTITAIVLVVNFSYAQWTNQTGTGDYYLTSGNVGIGTTSPLQKFVVSNNGAEGLEIYLAQPTGVVGLQSYNRTTSSYTKMQFDASSFVFTQGNVGIGTTSPSLPLQVNGTIYSATPVSNTVGIGTSWINNANYNFIGYQGYWGFRTATNNSYNLDVFNGGSPISVMTALQNGNMLIGQSSQVNSAYKLEVAGSVRANEIVVNTSGADFVFDPTYKLPSISSLKKFIDKNHHLPEIPSAKQMQVEGLSVGENQVKLLQKVEELTLYLIEKDKQITSQRQKLTDQQQQLTSQQEQINLLKQQLELKANKLK